MMNPLTLPLPAPGAPDSHTISRGNTSPSTPRLASWSFHAASKYRRATSGVLPLWSSSGFTPSDTSTANCRGHPQKRQVGEQGVWDGGAGGRGADAGGGAGGRSVRSAAFQSAWKRRLAFGAASCTVRVLAASAAAVGEEPAGVAGAESAPLSARLAGDGGFGCRPTMKVRRWPARRLATPKSARTPRASQTDSMAWASGTGRAGGRRANRGDDTRSKVEVQRGLPTDVRRRGLASPVHTRDARHLTGAACRGHARGGGTSGATGVPP